MLDIALKGLQDWYQANTNGVWEHQHGVAISTFDNPGWSVRIDLVATRLANRPFAHVARQGDCEHDWVNCQVKDFEFQGSGGPQNLEEILLVFLEWASA